MLVECTCIDSEKWYLHLSILMHMRSQARSCASNCSICCRCIYSGSWDYSVRVWHRSSLELAGIVPFDDWVFGLASRGDHLLAGVSCRLHVLDTTTLKPLKTLYHQVGNLTLKPLKTLDHQVSDPMQPCQNLAPPDG